MPSYAVHSLCSEKEVIPDASDGAETLWGGSFLSP